MATQAGFSWAAFIWGAIAIVLLVVAIGLVIVFGGFYPIAASTGDPPVIGWALEELMEHGVKRNAGGLKAPQLTAADVREGGSHYKAMCEVCHGGPGTERGEFATAMNPRPPELSKAAAHWSEAEIFWIAKHGIKMSAMPAFGKTDEDEELWKVAAFVKSLPKLGAVDYAALPKAHEHEEGEGGQAEH